MRMNTPLAVVRPELDQLPGACKNYFTVGRWVDVSNQDYGVTWATIDAPLVEVGADRRGRACPTCGNPDNWIKHLEPSQTLYSYVMNNYWETNYKADQEGPTPFRYALRPHAGTYDADRRGPVRHRAEPAAGGRAGRRRSAPAEIASRLRLDSDDVIVESFKPSRDGRGLDRPPVRRGRAPGQGPARLGRPAAGRRVPEQPGRRAGRAARRRDRGAALRPGHGPGGAAAIARLRRTRRMLHRERCAVASAPWRL